jgi:hypothetical protein
MAQSKIINESVKPLYAVAGAYELAYEYARGYAAEAQERVSKIEREPKALQNQAVSAINARLDELSKDAKEAQAKFEARVQELQKEARRVPKRVQGEIDEAVTELARTYADLVDRGEKIVAAIRKDGVRAVSAVRNAPSRSSVARRERAKVAADKGVDTPVRKSATKKDVAPKTPAKDAANKVSPATEKAKSTSDSAKSNANKATAKTAQATSKAAQATANNAQSTANKSQSTAKKAQSTAKKTDAKA